MLTAACLLWEQVDWVRLLDIPFFVSQVQQAVVLACPFFVLLRPFYYVGYTVARTLRDLKGIS